MQQSPYVGYSGWSPAPMAAPPPSPALKVLGILGCVFGGLNAAGNALSVLQALLQSMTPVADDADPQMQTMKVMLDATKKLAIGEGVVMLLMDVALVVVSVLLLKRSELGRKLAIVWSSVAFIVLIGRGIAFELVLMPVYNQFMAGVEASAKGAPMGGIGYMSAFARGGTYASLAFMAVFPGVLFILMTLKSVKESVVRPAEG